MKPKETKRIPETYVSLSVAEITFLIGSIVEARLESTDANSETVIDKLDKAREFLTNPLGIR